MRVFPATLHVIVRLFLRYRFLVCALLVPFAHDPGPIVPDVLDNLLTHAAGALPQAIEIGHHLFEKDSTTIGQVAAKLTEAIGCSIENRLLVQYATSLACAQQVYY